jgi:hypothetical protein
MKRDPLTGETPARWLQRGVSVPDPLRPGERLTLWADPNWDHLPGSDGAERRLVDRLVARADELSSGIREVVLADLAARGADFAWAAVAANAAKQTAYIMAPSVPELVSQARLDSRLPSLDGLALALGHDRVRHIMAQHGAGTHEALRGQRTVRPEDLAALPAVLGSDLTVSPGTPSYAPSGAALIKVVARHGGETWEITLEVQRKQGLLVPYTLWIR